ncbi:MAG TPA: alpha/beta hydrolase [Bacteroidales bacterium]|nr:alpha/beta hydrolase [Bacteroidales bacterium]HBZ20782.1 alpha/beta hydrolase [Bacteroidales bacterium]
MKKLTIVLLLLIIIAETARTQDQISNNSAVGSWLGKLDVSSITLRIVFNLSLIENDSIAATLDSPDQGAKNIKIGPVTLDGKDISIKAPLLLAEYTGTFKNDSLIEGTFKQAGQSIPLNLIKLRKAFALNRPQEPKPPFPYLSEDVRFTNEKAGIELAGTLTMPDGDGPFPAVILITGSGSQNRNEELMGHKPFWVIADHLSRNGIAVLRYDDRGVGQSKGSPLNATSGDFADDAGAAFLYLRTRKEIDPESIGLAGHSEGGLIAPIVASSDQRIAFIISLAGPGVTGEQILHKQNHDISMVSGADEKQVMKGISINKKLFAILRKEPDNDKAAYRITAAYKKILIKEKVSPEDIEKDIKQLNSSLNPVSYNWFRYFISTDPKVFWKKVRCPVLALNGEKDLQVAADINLPAIEKALIAGGNKKVKTVKLPELNHLFQHCQTGLPAEYGEIEETFSPEVLKIMSDWINGLY